MSEPLLSVQDLHTHFKGDDGVVKAVDGLSFELQAGETLGIVGESGSGKTVTGLSILRLVPCPPGCHPSGRVIFRGRDLMQASATEMRHIRGNRIAMIFQDPMSSLNPFLTVDRQLTEVLELHKGLDRHQARRSAIDMLERVGIPDATRCVGQYAHQLSGGMCQRVMIAMALLCEPALLIADEPTTALDVTIQAQVLELIGGITKELATSVILITHDFGVVAGMADRVLVMYAGRGVEEAPTAQLFSQASHPYSRALLESVPRLDGQRRDRLASIRGLPPDLTNLPPGCPFHPRCERAQEQCAQAYPPTSGVGLGQWAACWDLPAETSPAEVSAAEASQDGIQS